MKKGKIKFVSPRTQQELKQAKNVLIASENECYPIVDGIPRFIGSDSYATPFGLQWKKFATTQLDSHTGEPITEERLRKSIGEPLERLKGKVILEAGCGSGRFTEILLKYGAIVYSFDLSSAVEMNFELCRSKGDLHCFQASINELPFASNQFDYVICLGVLQHTPNTFESIKCLFRMLKKGGKLIVDHYAYNLNMFTSLFLFYWFIIRLMPPNMQFKITDLMVKLFFPVHWFFRDQPLVQLILRRISPINFYYEHYPLNKDILYEWSRLDTHDRNTDYYKRHITKKRLNDYFEAIGGKSIKIFRSGTGSILVGNCIKP